MEHRTYVTFEWDTEDNAEFDAGGNIVAPGGRQIIEDLQRGLRQRGFSVTDVVMHEFYGWSFNAISERVQVWCMIQYAEPWLLVTDVPFSRMHWLLGRKPRLQHSRVCTAIHDVLASSRRARTIQWFSPREYNQSQGSEGADRP
ncbi:MAG: hypothetical protein WD894_16565 [Pirellulales bacterium]